ncbi:PLASMODESMATA CALLOSE-BINDING PROTEIN 5 isoform X2 [Morus notabilis]|uniref:PLASMODESMATA CALLOSE-BINDING PROTEIN 5 isoform X2 n=1 Tax=Morus notabilis TaxID=981085 RepID=UPI000CED438A|nr:PLASMODESMATA CALLOSE-BINDING PROTEIN 5 isoform X2 [Morus notabilis]
MGKIFDFPLLLLLLLTSLHSLPLSGASLHCQSKAQNGVVTMELWCVAKNNAEDTALQTALDWACGPGGADCGPIQQGGPCYDASDVQTTASYAFNNYYLKNGMTDDACNFDNTAALTSLNPSHDKCKFPSSEQRIKSGESVDSGRIGAQRGHERLQFNCFPMVLAYFQYHSFLLFHQLLIA